jgi:heptaprenyl diphosphate synthase
LARRRNTLSSSLGIGDKLFASNDERRFVRDIEDGLDVVEQGLLVEMSFADDMARAATCSRPAASASAPC